MHISPIYILACLIFFASQSTSELFFKIPLSKLPSYYFLLLRTKSERAIQHVIFSVMADNMELFKQFQDNPSFKKWPSKLVFNLTYNPDGKKHITLE